MKRTLFCLLAFAAATASAAAQTSFAPREVAERVAVQVEENFYDEVRAGQIAAELRANASTGRYDSYTVPLDLAAALTATLHPHDGHFRVEWAAAAPPGAQGPSIAQTIGADARGNYGFAQAQMFPGGVGYLDVRGFAHFTRENAEDAPERRAADAAMTMVSGAASIIVDLRDCAGGSPAMVGYFASYFAPQGADIYNTFRSRRGESSEAPFVEPRGERRIDTPLYILTSGRTASACEAFAYTLKNAGRATTVGTASAGGANPGGYIPVGDGFSVFVSGGTPVSPITHANWEGTGVLPTVETSSEDALGRARELALEAEISANGNAAPEARWALASLRAETAPYPRSLRDYAGQYGPRSVAIENGRLVLHRDRRPGLVLLPLERDLFAIAGAAPLQQIRFERDTRGRVIALTLTLITGQQFRNTRG